MNKLVNIVVSCLCFLRALDAVSEINVPVPSTCDLTDNSLQDGCNNIFSEDKNQKIQNVPHSNYTNDFITANVTRSCIAHLEYLMTHHISFHKQHSNVIDKLEVHLGRLKDVWPESFEECLSVRTTDHPESNNSMIRGQYCLVYFFSSAIENITYDEFNIMKNKREATRFPYPILQTGMCIPDSCSATDLQEWVKYLLKEDARKYTIFVPPSFCQTDKPKSLPLATKLVGAGIIIVVSMVIVGTILEVMEFRKKSSSKSKKKQVETNKSNEVSLSQSVVRCFSLFSNCWYLFKMDAVHTGDIPAFNGVRFGATVGCIMVHLIMIGNFNAWSDVNEHPFFISASVHGFFYIQLLLQVLVLVSGAGIAMSAFHRIQTKKENLNLISFYSRRIWRLSGPYFSLILFVTHILPYLGSGPKWPEIEIEAETCKTNWWANVLYINNYVNDPICLFHTWYLSADVQLLLIAPIFILAFKRSVRMGLTTVAIGVSFSVSKIFYHAYYDSLNPRWLSNGPTSPKALLYFRNLYFLPASRLGCYCTGITVGYITHRFGKSFKVKQSIRRWAPTVATLFIFSPVLLWFRVTNITNPPVSHLESALCEALSRILFSVSAAYIGLSIYVGYQDIATRMFRSVFCPKFFIITSKLNYGYYLLHVVVLKCFLSSLPQPMEFTAFRFLKISFCLLVLTYLLAIPFTLLTIYPFARLEKLIEQGLKRNKLEKDIKQS